MGKTYKDREKNLRNRKNEQDRVYELPRKNRYTVDDIEEFCINDNSDNRLR